MQVLVCIMCGFESVVCAIRSHDHRRFAPNVSLRSVGRMNACTHSKPVKAKFGVQLVLGRSFVEATDEIPHIYIYM